MAEFFDDRSQARELTRRLRRLWLSIANDKLPQIQEELMRVRVAIQLNEDGSFQAGDLDLFDAVGTELIQALRDYADSLPGGP